MSLSLTVSSYRSLLDLNGFKSQEYGIDKLVIAFGVLVWQRTALLSWKSMCVLRLNEEQTRKHTYAQAAYKILYSIGHVYMVNVICSGSEPRLCLSSAGEATHAKDIEIPGNRIS